MRSTTTLLLFGGVAIAGLAVLKSRTPPAPPPAGQLGGTYAGHVNPTTPAQPYFLPVQTGEDFAPVALGLYVSFVPTSNPGGVVDRLTMSDPSLFAKVSDDVYQAVKAGTTTLTMDWHDASSHRESMPVHVA